LTLTKIERIDTMYTRILIKKKTWFSFRKMFIYDPTCLTFILGDRCDVVGKYQDRYLIKKISKR